MKKVHLLLLLIIVISSCNSVKRYCGFCLLIPRHIEIPLYKSPHIIDVSDYIINDTINEDYPLIAIQTIKDSVALVFVEYPMGTKPNTKGWIQLRYLGIFLRQPSDLLPAYKSPSYDSEIFFEISRSKSQWGQFHHIIDVIDGWIQIPDPNNPEKQGWIPPEYQSTNPYTSPC